MSLLDLETIFENFGQIKVDYNLEIFDLEFELEELEFYHPNKKVVFQDLVKELLENENVKNKIQELAVIKSLPRFNQLGNEILVKSIEEFEY